MFTTELIVGTGANTVSLDLKDDLPISLNFNIADIKRPESRNGAFSKTVTLYGTKVNNQFFEHTYEVNIVTNTFNRNLKTDCYILQDGSIVFEGYLRLMSIEKILQNNIEEIKYEASIFGDNHTLFAEIGDSKLTDLDLSAYDHTLSRVNQYNSWTATQGVGYVYPMIDYGSNSFNFNSYNVIDFRPAVYLKQYIDSIFSDAGKTYTSAFFNTAFFKRLIVPHNGEKLTMSPSTMANYQAFVGDDGLGASSNNALTYTPSNSWSLSSWSLTTQGFIMMFDDDTTSPYNDAGNIYNPATGVFTIAANGVYNITQYINPQIKFNNTSAFTTVVNHQPLGVCTWVKMLWRANSTSSWSCLDNQAFYSVNGTWTNSYSSLGAVNVTWSPKSLSAGNELMFVYDVGVYNTWGVDFYNGVTLVTTGTASYDIKLDTGCYTKLTIQPTYVEGATLYMSDVIPKDIKQKDFLKSVVQLFNLYIDIDKTNKNNYLIEPRNDFYSGGTTIDWSDKLAWDKPFTILPMSEMDAKKYIYKYKDDSDYYNKRYQDSWEESYGQHTLNIVNDFTKSENKNEVIFSPTPVVNNVNNALIMPFIGSYDGTVVKPVKHNIRLLMYNGVVTNASPKWNYVAQSSDILGAATLPMTTYPQCAMVDDPTNPTESIEFGVPNEVFYTLGTNYTTNNLYNRFYSRMMNEITDRDSIVVTAYFYLEPVDIANFDFRNAVYVKDAYYLVNKINDYNPLVKGLSKVELLKLKQYSDYTATQFLVTEVSTNSEEVGMRQGLITSNGINSNNVVIGNNNSARSQGSFISGNSNSVGSDSYRISIIDCEGVQVASHCTGITASNCSGSHVYSECYSITLNNCNDTIVKSGVVNFLGINLTNELIGTEYSNKIKIGSEVSNFAVSWESKTADFAVDDSIQCYEVDCTLGNVTATLDPTVYDYTNKIFYFKRVDSSANSFFIDELTGAPNIDGNAVPYNTGMIQWDCLVLGNNGTNYRIL